MVSNIELVCFPVDYLTGELVWDILFLHSLAQLHACSTNFRNFVSIGLRFQMDEVTEKIKMGLDAQKSLTKGGQRWKCAK